MIETRSISFLCGALLIACGGNSPSAATGPSNGGAPAGGSNSGPGGNSGAMTAGGSSNQSGGASQGGTSNVQPPHVVNPCPTGSAPGVAAQKWENITPEGVDLNIFGGMQAVQVNPQDTSVVYAAASRQGIYKSTDCGATWKKINTGRSADVLATGSQWSFVIDPMDPNVMYTANGYSNDMALFKSTNGGVDWDSLMPAGGNVDRALDVKFVQEVAMDPTDHKHLVVTFHADCKPPNNGACMAESTDSGATWRIFDGPGKGWTEGTGPIVIDSKTMLVAQAFDGLFLTTDSGATWKQVGKGGYRPGYNNKGTWVVGSAQRAIQRSTDNARTWTEVAGAPSQVNGICGDGEHIYAGTLPGTDYYVATASVGTDWVKMTNPTGSPHGSNWLTCDRDHHLIYSNTQDGGLWRLQTQ
jgi:hypothetical protein